MGTAGEIWISYTMEDDDAMLFKNLIAPPPPTPTAYLDLKKKVDEHVYRPPPPPLPSYTVVVLLCDHERQVVDLLARRERNLAWLPNPNAERRVDFLERRIEEHLAAARLLVYDLVVYRLRRLVACAVIQRTMLRILYTPRPGQLPKISRSLLDEGLVGTGEFGSTVDNGDGDD